MPTIKEIEREAAKGLRSVEKGVARDVSFLRREIQEEKRVPIPSDTKKSVYERANGRCECCGRPLKMNQGDFHHLRAPTTKPSPFQVQFLCGTDHKIYGHEWKGERLYRKKVRKIKSPYWKEKRKATKKKPRTRTKRKVTKTKKKTR